MTGKINQVFFIFDTRELSVIRKDILRLNLSRTNLGEPNTRPPSCTIYIFGRRGSWLAGLRNNSAIPRLFNLNQGCLKCKMLIFWNWIFFSCRLPHATTTFTVWRMSPFVDFIHSIQNILDSCPNIQHFQNMLVTFSWERDRHSQLPKLAGKKCWLIGEPKGGGGAGSFIWECCSCPKSFVGVYQREHIV